VRNQAIQVLHDARGYLQRELEQRKYRQGWLSFDDLLTRLATAPA